KADPARCGSQSTPALCRRSERPAPDTPRSSLYRCRLQPPVWRAREWPLLWRGRAPTALRAGESQVRRPPGGLPAKIYGLDLGQAWRNHNAATPRPPKAYDKIMSSDNHTARPWHGIQNAALWQNAPFDAFTQRIMTHPETPEATPDFSADP